VRAFVDFLKAALGDGDHDPWWPAEIPVPGRRPRARARRADTGIG
jgi:hypothetical protein